MSFRKRPYIGTAIKTPSVSNLNNNSVNVSLFLSLYHYVLNADKYSVPLKGTILACYRESTSPNLNSSTSSTKINLPEPEPGCSYESKLRNSLTLLARDAYDVLEVINEI